MECPRCGAYNPESAVMCDLCSCRLGQEPAAAPSEQQLPPGAHSGQERGSPKLTGLWASHKKTCVGAMVVVVLLAAGVFTWLFAFSGPNNPHPRSYSILFIGNSYTYENNLTATVSDIAASLGNHTGGDASALGGYTLRQHASNPDTTSKIISKKWDFVVLQEQSQLPATYSDAQTAQYITPYARELNSMIHQASPSAVTVLFETWGRKNGDTDNASMVPAVADYNGDQARISATYHQLAVDLPATLAPVGEAWSLVRQSHPEIDLYMSDGSHPSIQGTYLAACVLYDTFFKTPVTGASQLSLDSAQARVLQEAADQTVLPGANKSK